MPDLRKAVADLQFEGRVLYDEPLAVHTSFKVGGPADIYLIPASMEDVMQVMRFPPETPLFILGAGANILVSDLGIRGIVMDMSGLSDCAIVNSILNAGAGLGMSDAAGYAGQRGYSGLEFIYSMPGSVGGSVWMNARCYERSISDVLAFVDIVDGKGELNRIVPEPREFAYKVSPFQQQRWAIVSAGFALEKGNVEQIKRTMEEHEQDRNRKGHFDAPSAGSVFKNNRRFGAPSGKIIDDLGMRGTQVGGAKISERHANIIVNTGTATAEDIFVLIRLIEETVREARGFALEREVRLVGEWTMGGHHERDN